MNKILQPLFPKPRYYKATTRLSPDEVKLRLTNNIRTRNFLPPSKNHYRGYVKDDFFQIAKISGKHQSSPMRGQINAQGGITTIKAYIKEDQLRIALKIVWFGTISLACFGILLAVVTQPGRLFEGYFHPFCLVPFFMLFLGYFIASGAFDSDCRELLHFLTDTLEVEQIEEFPFKPVL